MIADPAFLGRLLLEQATTIGCSVWWEIQNRKERIKQEWDLALINVLTVTACNAIVVWSLGLYANLRYQLLCGFDRATVNYFDVIGVALFFSTALRVLNVQVGETSRMAWLGVEADPLVHSEDLLKAYNRPSENIDQSSSKWFISRNAIVSGLGFLGIRQGQTESKVEGDAPAPKTRRKRIVKRKAAAS